MVTNGYQSITKIWTVGCDQSLGMSFVHRDTYSTYEVSDNEKVIKKIPLFDKWFEVEFDVVTYEGLNSSISNDF